jgi:uncharacterized membrane protein YkoI
MSRFKKLIIVGSAVAALAAGGAAAAGAVGGGDDGEKQATGPGADSAREAALQITNGGTANSVERDGENGATWEVEVTKTDGNTVDVRLDEQYGLVVIEGDNDQAESGN